MVYANYDIILYAYSGFVMTGVMSTAWNFWRTAMRHYQTMEKWLWQNAYFRWLQIQAWPQKVWFTLMWSCWLIIQVGKREHKKSLRILPKVLDSKVSKSIVMLSTHTSWSFLRRFKFFGVLHLSFDIEIVVVLLLT